VLFLSVNGSTTVYINYANNGAISNDELYIVYNGCCWETKTYKIPPTNANLKSEKIETISLDEIQNNRPIKSRQNMSFKNKSNRSILRYTMKNRSSSSDTSDADHSLQQEAEE
jgi:hypothetical protein